MSDKIIQLAVAHREALKKIDKLESLLREAYDLLFFDGLFEYDELEKLEKFQANEIVKELMEREE